MKDRGMLKWAPFAAVFTPAEVIQEIQDNKSKKNKPILAEDELEKLNQDLLDYFHSNSFIKITFFETEQIHSITGTIQKIDMTRKTVLINNHSLYASQIINIKINN